MPNAEKGRSRKRVIVWHARYRTYIRLRLQPEVSKASDLAICLEDLSFALAVARLSSLDYCLLLRLHLQSIAEARAIQPHIGPRRPDFNTLWVHAGSEKYMAEPGIDQLVRINQTKLQLANLFPGVPAFTE